MASNGGFPASAGRPNRRPKGGANKHPQGGVGAAMAVASRALQLAKQVSNAVEIKRYQQTTTQTNYLAGVVTHLTGIAQGDGVSARTGDAVRLRAMEMRLRLATFTDSDCAWRIIVFSDLRQVSGTAPAVTTVLDSDSALSPYSIATAGRWHVYKDMVFNQNARFLNGDMADDIVWHIPLNRTARWSGGTYNAGQIFCLITCDVASAASMAGKPAAGDSATRFTVDVEYTDD